MPEEDVLAAEDVLVAVPADQLVEPRATEVRVAVRRAMPNLVADCQPVDVVAAVLVEVAELAVVRADLQCHATVVHQADADWDSVVLENYLASQVTVAPAGVAEAAVETTITTGSAIHHVPTRATDAETTPESRAVDHVEVTRVAAAAEVALEVVPADQVAVRQDTSIRAVVCPVQVAEQRATPNQAADCQLAVATEVVVVHAEAVVPPSLERASNFLDE